MNMKNVTIVGEDGTNQTASLIAYLKNGNDYGLFYTMNEPGSSDQTVKIYYGKEKQDNPMLDTPLSDEEWDKANSHMRTVIKGDASTVEYLPPKDSYSIIGFRATNMPISYDFINKQVNLYYANNFGEVAPEASVVPETPAVPEEPVVPESPVIPEVPTEVPAPEMEADKPVPPVTPEVPAEPAFAPDINIPSVSDLNAEPAPVDAVAPLAGEAPVADGALSPVEPPVEAPAAPEEPVVADAPVEAPADALNIFETPAPLKPTPNEPVEPVVDSPVDTGMPTVGMDNQSNIEADAGNSIEFIKEKYKQMRDFIDQLEQMEIDAVNRIEDTMKLNDMANAQHAEAVAQDMGMSNDAPPMPTEPVEPAAPEVSAPDAAPIDPVTPVVPEAPAAQDAGETNWFDTPQAA